MFLRLTVVLLVVWRYMDAHIIQEDHAQDCSTWPPPCSQVCHATDGGHGVECSCQQGYILNEDHKHCRAEEWMKGPYLVYTQDKNMAVKLLSDLDSPSYELPSIPVPDVRIGTFAVDASGFNIYYSSTMPGFSGANRDLNIIKVTDLEGKNDTQVITRGLLSIASVAMDWVGKVLYIGDQGLHQIVACSISTHHCSTIKHVGDPTSVAVNSLQRKLYWSDCSSSHSQLYQSNMDGTETEVLIQLNREGCIEELQVDVLQNTLYWINKVRGLPSLINSMRLDTKHITDINRPTSALAVFADDLFWTDTSDDPQYQSMMTTIYFEDKFEMEIPEDHFYRRHGPEWMEKNLANEPVHMAVVHKVQQPDAFNPCEGSLCSHMCMLKSGNKTSCGCPAGLSLSEDGFSCYANWTIPSVVVVNDRRLVRVVPDLIGSNDLDILFETQDEITALAFDWSSSSIYFSTNASSGEFNSISRLLLHQMPNAKEEVVYKESSSIVDMEVDWTSNNIYWISYESKDIMVGRLDGSAKMSLMQSINKSGIVESPAALALHPSERKLYYSDCGAHPHIGVCDMAGHDCVTKQIDVNGGCASDLYLEISTGWLYWTDNKLHKVMKSDPAQSSTEQFRIASVPISVVAGGDGIFWTGGYMSGILYATEQVSRDTVIHFGVEGFKKMIYYADFAQQPQEKNKCSTANGECAQGICIPTRTGHRCLTSETEATEALKPLTTSDQYSSNMEQPSSQTTVTSGQVNLPKTSKIRKPDLSKNQCDCLNGGECDVQAGGICRCSDEYQGSRCELKKADSANSPISDHLSPADNQTIMYAAVGVVGIAVLLAVIIAGVCIQKRCSASRRRQDDDETKTLGTPLYENPSGGKKIHTLSIPRPKVTQGNEYC